MLRALDQLIDAPLLDGGRSTPPGLGPLAPLGAALHRGPDARASLLRLRALVHGLGDEAPRTPWPAGGRRLRLLAAVLSAGPELGRILARDPARRLGLLLDPEAAGLPWSKSRLAEDLDTALARVPGAGEPLALALTGFRNDHFMRLAGDEFLGRPLEQVGRQLSHVADLCLDAALDRTGRQLARRHGPPLQEGDAGLEPCGLVALAMGKHGAQELNFCSDVDLIFIYSSDEGAAGHRSLHEFFSRLCQQTARLLSEPNAEGLCFRVDLGLRPEGSRGPICNSLAGAERYYETWGGGFDRLAWLKARPAAGDLELGRRMVRLLSPFVFPRSIQPEIVEQLGELGRRLRVTRRDVTDGWDVKLQAGGIRDVEFFVQALQLLHGGKRPALQAPATLPALERLLFAGLIGEQEQRQLAEAYVLWRRVEHRLQIHGGRQTHLLPHRGPLRRWLAGHLGLSEEALGDEIAGHRRRVRAIHRSLTAAPELTPEAGAEAPLALLLEDPPPPRDEALGLLEQAGFADPARALSELQRLADRPWSPLGRAAPRALARLRRPLLRELPGSPDPDAVLHHLARLTLRVGPYPGLWQMLGDNLHTLRLLLNLFGTSDHLARHFIRHPELLDTLLQSGRATPRRPLGDLRHELRRRMDPLDPEDHEARLRELRRLHNEELLRVGLHDIAGELDVQEVWDQLAQLADALLEQAFALAWRQTEARYGTPRHPDGDPAALAVLALGTLGSREVTYGSDLDLIFVYSGAGHSEPTAAPTRQRRVDNGEWFARLAQRFISALTMDLEEGRLYQVDTRLRPSGNQGLLVTSLDAFQRYHSADSRAPAAQTWERQVLIKARPVAGDPPLGRQVHRWVQAHLYAAGGPADPDAQGHELHRHRLRMERELSGEGGGFVNLKLGRGGLLDVDFVVQHLQLRHGHGDPALRRPATLDALDALTSAGHLAPREAQILARGYRFLRRLEARLRLVRDRPASRLPDHPAGLEAMARRLGNRATPEQTPGQQLLAAYQDHTRRIREIYLHQLGPGKKDK